MASYSASNKSDMSPQQWEIRSIKFVKSRVLERLSFFELLLILFDKGKICEKVFFLTNDVRERRGDYFFFKGFAWSSARSRKFSRARFHGTVLCKHTGCRRQAAEPMQTALWLRLPSVRSMFPYDLYLRLIVLISEREFLLLLFFFLKKKKKNERTERKSGK